MLARFFVTVSSFTLLSRIFGFIRDILLAAFLGAGPLAQVFLVALKLPNFFRRLFAEGAFNAAFVPMFSSKLEAEGKSNAKIFAENIFALLLVTLIIFTLIFELFMPYVLYVVAPGFVDNADMFSLAVELTRITFPYLLFISVATIFASILNGNSKFAAVAFMPVLFNLCLILFLLFGTEYFETSAYSLSWGVFVAGIIQIIWMIFNLRKIDFTISFKLSNLKVSDDVKVFLKKLAPGAIGAGITQINLWIDIVIATFFSGAVAFLYYADRVNQLPLSIIGTAMGTALLPTLSKNIASGNMGEANKNYNQSIITVLLLTIPATFAFLAISQEIISILFERGEFSSEATSASSNALMIYSLGLPAFALIKVFSSSFFALKDTKTPVIVATYSLVVNLILNISLVLYFQKIGIQPHLGLALATSIAGWSNALYMYFILKNRSDFELQSGFLGKVIKILFASIVMAASVSYWFESLGHGVWQLFFIVILGIIIYFTCVIMFKVITLSHVKQVVKKDV